MTDQQSTAPQSPETQPADVREELDQDNVTHEGQQRSAADAGATPTSHFGAVEDDSTGHSDQVPVTPPMAGPANLIDDREGEDPSVIVDPQDEITGGA
jgi:hypothetical protein